MLDKIKLILGVTDQDALLTVLIDDCKADAVNYCHLDSYDTAMDNIVRKMVIEKFNRRGSDGITARSFSGVSESYGADYSDEIYKQLKTFRKMKTL